MELYQNRDKIFNVIIGIESIGKAITDFYKKNALN